jgi:hypothetical protein
VSRPLAPFVHGTYAGWQKHRKRGETPCTACRDAAAQYMRDHRAANVGARRKDRWWNNTRNRALGRLAAEYPARFSEILTEIRAETVNEWSA